MNWNTLNWVAACVGIVMLRFAILTPTADGQQRELGSSQANLQRIVLAMHVFHGEHGNFPAHASYRDGKALLSWRVHLLPSLGEDALYRQFRLDEAWDSPHNRTLIAKLPKVYSDADASLTKSGRTRFQVPLGDNHVFNTTPQGTRSSDIKDGPHKTILVIEAATKAAAVWTKPEDITIDHAMPTDRLAEDGQDHFNVAFADGRTRRVATSIDADELRAMFTRNESD